MQYKARLNLIVLLLFVGALGGCIFTPTAVPTAPLRTDVKVVDKETHAALSDVRAVLLVRRSEGYLPDTKPGKEKSPTVIVGPIEQSSSITLTDHEVYFYPFFATGTVYGPKAAWIFKQGYAPVPYPWGEPGASVTVELVGCDVDESKRKLIELLSSEIRDARWKADTVSSLQALLKWKNQK